MITDMKQAVANKLTALFGIPEEKASVKQIYKAVSLVLKESIMEKWSQSERDAQAQRRKKLYYLSMEFLMGRALGNNLMNMDLTAAARETCAALGVDLAEVREAENDPGLGHGGLGRLAACFLDSIATLGLSGHGCGIRYEYGLFKQKIVDGNQTEIADNWLEDGNVWEVAKPEEAQIVKFGNFEVRAVPYDMPVLGYQSPVVNTLRLWSAQSVKPVNLNLFNQGEYVNAFAEKDIDEAISKLLYPEDHHLEGKALRLKQQYFFVSASIQSIIARYKAAGGAIRDLAQHVAIHINDTHPSLGIPELMRILMDEEGLNWQDAWDITIHTFAYTNHTIMQEAMERWPVPLFKYLMPRIYEIVHEINEIFCQKLWECCPGEWGRIAQMAIVANDEVRMAHLAMVGSFSINGVSALHTRILQEDVFQNFYAIFPEKFHSITNGVTHRRFLLKANPRLAELVTTAIGDRWMTEPLELKRLEALAGDSAFCGQLAAIRHDNKVRLAQVILEKNGIAVDPSSIFDVQVKRLHEYKRQLLNVLHIMKLYNQLRSNPQLPIPPRTFLFGAKAAQGYGMAKAIIRLIHAVAQRINNDKDIGDRLKVVFLEDYRVSLAEKIFPAADVSEQISTAGKEASGTGCMKFMLNGALTVGTLDGANVEMREAVGAENLYIFGLTAAEVAQYCQGGSYRSLDYYEQDPVLKEVVDQLVNGFLQAGGTEAFYSIYNSLLYSSGGMSDPYFVLKDFMPYCTIQELIGQEYCQPGLWWKKAVLNIANAGRFSSDSTIRQYNEEIWQLAKF